MPDRIPEIIDLGNAEQVNSDLKRQVLHMKAINTFIESEGAIEWDFEIARRISEVSARRGGSFFVNELNRSDIVFAIDKGWVTPVGVGHFRVTSIFRS